MIALLGYSLIERADFFKLPDGQVVFVQSLDSRRECIGFSDGTQAGTHVLADIPGSSNADFLQVEVVGRHFAIYMDNNEFFLFDPELVVF